MKRQSAETTIVIKNFDVDHVGTYGCEATNEFGNDSKEVTVEIKLAPVITLSPQLLKLQEGQNSSVRCDVTGEKGESKMNWIYDGKYWETSVSILDEIINMSICYRFTIYR